METMNSSVSPHNASNFVQSIEIVKASITLVDCIICTMFSVLIITTVRQNSELRKEVRFWLLCHHLLCLTLFFAIGTVFSGMRALQVSAPRIVCWITFAVQIIIGRGILLTLTMMSLNACLAICWPLKYLSCVHSVKSKVMVCVWIIALLDPVLSLIYESTNNSLEEIVQLDPSCPTSLDGIVARIAGIVFVLLLVILIILSYMLIYREAKRAGHFKNPNKTARNTIIIHGLQITLHIVPTLITIGIGGKAEFLALNLTNFVIFSFAQCFSPVIYGLRCRELQCKLKIMHRNPCCASQVTSRLRQDICLTDGQRIIGAGDNLIRTPADLILINNLEKKS